MSHADHHKHKHAAVLAQQKKFQKINSNAEEHQAQTDRVTAQRAAMAEAAPVVAEDGSVVIRRTSALKGSLAQKKNLSRHRWHEFVLAGGGGMGR